MPGAHVELSPSSASRWMACPGSLALLRTLPEGDTSSPYAEEGTKAHALAEAILRRQTVWDVDLDMALHVQVYTDHAQRLRDDPACRYFAVESRLTLDLFNPPGPMGGTADCLALLGDALHVVDLKYGQGVAVDVTDNAQLQYYGLMALVELERKGFAPKTVTITVVQPRKPHPDGPIRSVTYTVAEVLAFAERLLDAAHATTAPDAPRRVGSHCRFCDAKPICPEKRDEVRAMVAVDFDAIPASLPPQASWSVEELGAMLVRAEALHDYVESCRTFLRERLLAGASVPTHKLVQAQTRRAWADPAKVAPALEAIGVSRDDLYESKLVTPAEAERRLKVLGAAMPEGLIVTPPGAIVLAPITDRRPAVGVTAASDFSPCMESV